MKKYLISILSWQFKIQLQNRFLFVPLQHAKEWNLDWKYFSGEKGKVFNIRLVSFGSWREVSPRAYGNCMRRNYKKIVKKRIAYIKKCETGNRKMLCGEKSEKKWSNSIDVTQNFHPCAEQVRNSFSSDDLALLFLLCGI